MSKNKLELEKENKELKKHVKELGYKIDDLKLQHSNADAKSGEFPNQGFGVFMSDDGKFKIAFIKFDADSREAIVSRIEDAAKNNIDHSNAHMRGEIELDIMMKNIAGQKWLCYYQQL